MVAFTIQPPFWRTAWFLGAVMLLSGAALFALHKRRVARALEIERVRTRVATDLHDDIGSTLSQISVLSEVVGRSVNSDTETAERLALMAALPRDMLDS